MLRAPSFCSEPITEAAKQLTEISQPVGKEVSIAIRELVEKEVDWVLQGDGGMMFSQMFWIFCGMFSRISAKSLRAFYGEVLPATESAQSFQNAFVRRSRHVSRILIKGWNPYEIFAVPDWSQSMNPAQVLRKIFPSSKRHFEMSKRCRSEKWMFGVVVWGPKKGNPNRFPW